MRNRCKILSLILCAVFLFTLAPSVWCWEEDRTHPTGAEMFFDTLFLRPAGVAATAVGAIIWVVSLPVSLPTGSAEHAAEKMVLAPFRYTFDRPLGDNYGEGQNYSYGGAPMEYE